MITDPHEHPVTVYVVVARDGGPALFASWSRSIACHYRETLTLGRRHFVVKKYVAAPAPKKWRRR
jgi:hypothetical protein